jgi:hypothetical protein
MPSRRCPPNVGKIKAAQNRPFIGTTKRSLLRSFVNERTLLGEPALGHCPSVRHPQMKCLSQPRHHLVKYQLQRSGL